MTTAPATAAQVRKHFKDQGHEVRISRDGRVTHRPDPDFHPLRYGARSYDWLEGRWLSEYRVDDSGTVIS